MTKREREIQETKRKIEELKERLKKLEELPEFCEDEKLSEIEDFPINGVHGIYLYQRGIRTISDLVYSSPETILSIPSCGKATLRKINEWMQKHKLYFID